MLGSRRELRGRKIVKFVRPIMSRSLSRETGFSPICFNSPMFDGLYHDAKSLGKQDQPSDFNEIRQVSRVGAVIWPRTRKSGTGQDGCCHCNPDTSVRRIRVSTAILALAGGLTLLPRGSARHYYWTIVPVYCTSIPTYLLFSASAMLIWNN